MAEGKFVSMKREFREELLAELPGVPYDGEKAGIFHILGRDLRSHISAGNFISSIDTNLGMSALAARRIPGVVVEQVLNPSIRQANETLDKKILQAQIVSERMQRRLSPEEKGVYVRWIGADIAYNLAAQLSEKQLKKERLVEEVMIAMRRILLKSAERSESVDGIAVDNSWLLQEFIPKVTDLSLDKEARALLLREYVNSAVHQKFVVPQE